MRGTGATGATRGMGRTEGVVGRSSGGIELGLKVGGIGQLGISTDYGGGIVVGIFGQKIVWGREGGNIHYNFGGLEVIVEARDCVVVETRKIFGQVTGRHVYPDPGCKQPKLPDTASTKRPGVGSKLEELPGFDNNCLYYVIWLQHGRATRIIFNKSLVKTGEHEYYRLGTWTSTGDVLRVENLEIGYFSPGYIEWHDYPTRSDRAGYAINSNEGFAQIVGPGVQSPGIIEGDNAITFANGASGYLYNYGDGIKNWIKYWVAPDAAWEFSVVKISCRNSNQPPTYLTPKTPSSNLPSPSAGNQPPMPESCCEALAADIEDIKEVLACKEILAGKMTFPWSWRMPGGQGEEIIMDYPNLLRAIAQMIDHLGIHPPKLTIKDINNAIAGDQSINNQFPSATQAFEATMAQIWDANADVDTLTNFLYRLSWLCVQQSMNLARLSGDVQALKDMLGGATELVESSITTPFNIGAGVTEAPTKPGKGLGGQQKGKNIDRRIEANTEVSTESLLPDFLRIRENPIMVEQFSGDKDVMDMLSIIILKLESLQNR